jgi:hypothetical protein
LSYTHLRALLLAVMFALSASGCASAPVQEMSDARQAIRAARDAGAAQKAPQELDQARALLASAERHLEDREFRAAREDAVAARNRAIDAMERSQDDP